MNHTNSDQTNQDDPQRSQNHRHLTAAKLVRIIGWVVAGVAIACFFALIFGLLVKWLWGLTLTPLFGVPQLTYWQAVSLIILAKLFFGGVGHPHKKPETFFGYQNRHDRFHGSCTESHSFSHYKNADGQCDENDRKLWRKEGKKVLKDYLDNRRP